MEHFDRNIHDVDVMENVFRGVQLLSDDTWTSSASSDVVTLDVRAWLAGTAISAVQVTVLDDEPAETGDYGSAPNRSR